MSDRVPGQHDRVRSERRIRLAVWQKDPLWKRILRRLGLLW